MRGVMRIAVLVGALLAVVQVVSANWWEMWQADGQLDLPTARTLALAAISSDPSSADAVAAANWWFENLENIPSPEEPLSVDGVDRDPELGFILQKIDAELRAAPPFGSLTPAEVAGVFGVFSTLDLERGVVPADDGLPLSAPVGRTWRNPSASRCGPPTPSMGHRG